MLTLIITIAILPIASANAIVCNSLKYQLIGETSITEKNKNNEFKTRTQKISLNAQNGLGPNSNIYEKIWIKTSETILKAHLSYGAKSSELKIKKSSIDHYQIMNLNELPIEQEKSVQRIKFEFENNKKENCYLEMPYHAAD